MDIGEAKQVYDDLFEAVDSGLLLSNYLHLFYLVTPYSALEEVKLERQIYISIVGNPFIKSIVIKWLNKFKFFELIFQYSELSAAEKKVAERIGITEVCVIQYIRDGRVKVSLKIIIITNLLFQWYISVKKKNCLIFRPFQKPYLIGLY